MTVPTMSRELRDDLIQRIWETLGAATAREVLLAAVSDRVARTVMTDGELSAVAPALLELGLCAARSHKRFVSRPDRGKGGFSNRFATRHPQQHLEARWLLYIARDRQRADAAHRAEDGASSSDLGENLRYPACCVKWYGAAWPSAEQNHQGDLFPLSHESSVPLVACHPLLNFSANYFGGGWTSFFPCSLNCDAAARSLAQDRDLLYAVSPRLAAEADRHARCPVIYTEFRGIAQIARWEMDNSNHLLAYDPDHVAISLSSPRGRLWSAVLRADRIRPTGLFGFELLRGARRLHRDRSSDAFVRWFTPLPPSLT